MNMLNDAPESPAAAAAQDASGHGFDFITGWPAVTDEDGAAIKAFWRHEGALTDDAAMEQRLKQV